MYLVSIILQTNNSRLKMEKRDMNDHMCKIIIMRCSLQIGIKSCFSQNSVFFILFQLIVNFLFSSTYLHLFRRHEILKYSNKAKINFQISIHQCNEPHKCQFFFHFIFFCKVTKTLVMNLEPFGQNLLKEVENI